jgi:hypothetical protein
MSESSPDLPQHVSRITETMRILSAENDTFAVKPAQTELSEWMCHRQSTVVHTNPEPLLAGPLSTDMLTFWKKPAKFPFMSISRLCRAMMGRRSSCSIKVADVLPMCVPENPHQQTGPRPRFELKQAASIYLMIRCV